MKSHFFTGKGGTGKTTMAASFARRLAGEGRKTLLVSLDPAHSLADLLSFVAKGENDCAGTLTVHEPDFDSITADYLKQQLDTLRGMNSRLTAFNLDNLLDTLQYSPGQEEYAVALYLRRILNRSNDFEHAVFDTPPTGMVLRIFTLPLRSILWLERLIALREKIVDRRELIGKIRKADKAQSYYRDDPVLTKLRNLASDYSNLARFFTEEARIYLVINCDRLALAESARLRDKLSRIGMEFSGIIHNRFNESADTAPLESAGFDPGMMIRVPELTGDEAARANLPVDLAEELKAL
ncbi:AAA family ATPase [bacterium]|nr:AAA family ATPase [bacterium]